MANRSTKQNYTSIDSPGVLHIRTRYGLPGYAIYMALLDIMPKYGNCIGLPDLGYISIELNIEQKLLKDFLFWCAECDATCSLFSFDGVLYRSYHIQEQLERAKHIKEVRSRAAMKRWSKTIN